MNKQQLINKIHRGYNHYYGVILTFLHEKVYKDKTPGGRSLNYIITPPHSGYSTDMIVSFPACGPTAKYNYARTLNGVNCWRLFIKDDFGDEHTGNYLVEEKTERVVIGLIDHQIQKRNINRLFFIGSSKGAYSAINFSFHFPHVTVVAGGPQYYLADYLKKCNALSALHDILGDNYSEESFERLNCRLKEKILNQKIVPKAIYLHYSNKEHTYEEHIKDMLETFNKRGIRVYEDVCDYPYHSGLADFFPPFLKKTIKAIL